MSRTLTKFVDIKGCAVWLCDENGTPIKETPQIDNTTISMPDLEFGTTEVNLLGTLSVPDFTRIDNFQLSVNMPVDNDEAMELFKPGLQQWVISYAVSNFNSGTGLEEVTGYRIYAKGYITRIPSSEISKGGDGKANLPMNLVSLKKWKLGERTAVYAIDRLTGKVEIQGVNYTQPIDELY